MAIREVKRKRDGITVYMIDFRDQQRRRIREVAGTTRTQAKALLAKRIGEVRAKTYVNVKAAAREAEAERGPTVAEFAKQFLDDYASQRRSRYYEWTLPTILPHFEGRLMRDIAPSDLDAFRKTRLTEVSPSTVRKQLTVLGTMFRMARRWGVIPVNPAEDLEKPSEPPHRTRFLTPEEWDRLHANAEPWLRPVLTMALCTGARLKETVGIRWENLDRDEGVLHLTADNKTGKPRLIPIGKTAQTLLDAAGGRFKREGFVLASAEGLPYASDRQRNRITQRTKAAAAAAGLDGVTFHTLRHTVGSWLGRGTDNRQGFTETEIGWLLGHSSGSMTARYVHPHIDRLRAMVSRLDEVLARDGHPDGHEIKAGESDANASRAKSIAVNE